MRRFVLIIIFPLCLFVFVSFATQRVSAQEVSVSVTPVPTPLTYELPYPGLLPDHPFYFLKAARDNLTALFISKPLNKASFALLQSDKNVSASYLLIKQKKDVVLAQDTFATAQNYFEEALVNTAAAKKEGMHTKELVVKLKQSNEKHKEILKEIKKQVQPDQRKEFQKEQERAEKLAKMARALKP